MTADFNPVAVAVQACGGTQSALAKRLGVTRPLISQWNKRKEFPTNKLPTIAVKTGLPIVALLSDKQKWIMTSRG
jgi:DNA-binding transcriptional regulator YdaS (Cro superfamily)